MSDVHVVFVVLEVFGVLVVSSIHVESGVCALCSC